MTSIPIHAGVPLLRLASPEDLLAAVPYLLGFHPADSLVAVAVTGPRGRLTFTARVDLPPPDRREPLAQQVAAVLARQEPDVSILIGYGPRRLSEPALEAVECEVSRLDSRVSDVLCVEGGRYRSLRCRNVRCCPPEGRPFDVGSSAVAAQATVVGLTALPDRSDLERSLAPAGGAAVRHATERAEAQLAAWAREVAGPAALRRRLIGEGRTRIASALDRYRSGGRLADDEVAMLGLLLTFHRIRDEAWLLVDDRRRATHLALWRDVVRRVEPAHAAAPASLLAFTAWQHGDGALAQIALDRALQADADYSMAHLLGEALASGIPPVPWPPATGHEYPGPHGQSQDAGGGSDGPTH